MKINEPSSHDSVLMLPVRVSLDQGATLRDAAHAFIALLIAQERVARHDQAKAQRSWWHRSMRDTQPLQQGVHGY